MWLFMRVCVFLCLVLSVFLLSGSLFHFVCVCLCCTVSHKALRWLSAVYSTQDCTRVAYYVVVHACLCVFVFGFVCIFAFWLSVSLCLRVSVLYSVSQGVALVVSGLLHTGLHAGSLFCGFACVFVRFCVWFCLYFCFLALCFTL